MSKLEVAAGNHVALEGGRIGAAGRLQRRGQGEGIALTGEVRSGAAFVRVRSRARGRAGGAGAVEAQRAGAGLVAGTEGIFAGVVDSDTSLKTRNVGDEGEEQAGGALGEAQDAENRAGAGDHGEARDRGSGSNGSKAGLDGHRTGLRRRGVRGRVQINGGNKGVEHAQVVGSDFINSRRGAAGNRYLEHAQAAQGKLRRSGDSSLRD